MPFSKTTARQALARYDNVEILGRYDVPWEVVHWIENQMRDGSEVTFILNTWDKTIHTVDYDINYRHKLSFEEIKVWEL